MSSLSSALEQRSAGRCELCDTAANLVPFTVAPKEGHSADEQVAVCPTCLNALAEPTAHAAHWQCLTGAIWSETPAVQALSYKTLSALTGEDWAAEALESVEFPENVVSWATGGTGGETVIHKDAFGNELAAGDAVLLTQNLNVKGANFIAPKGTLVKKIRLVADNAEQIEGKINGDTIVILTKFVKKQG